MVAAIVMVELGQPHALLGVRISHVEPDVLVHAVGLNIIPPAHPATGSANRNALV